MERKTLILLSLKEVLSLNLSTFSELEAVLSDKVVLLGCSLVSELHMARDLEGEGLASINSGPH